MNPAGDESRTLPEWIRYGESFLTEHGVPNARNNAEWMLCSLLGCERLALYTSSPEKQGWQQAYRGCLERRARREPLQHIIGTTEFMSLPFETPAGVFVPRPETETLVEAAEKRLRLMPLDRDLTVLDLCCGSGIVAVSLAARIPNVVATAVDISKAAVETTKRNAALNGVSDRVEVVHGDAASKLDRGEYAAILCNPPYIKSGDIRNLPPEVREYDPPAALDGGVDGLDFYRRIVPLLADRLAEGGFVAFEIGDTQGDSVSGLLLETGIGPVNVLTDLSRFSRVVVSG